MKCGVNKAVGARNVEECLKVSWGCMDIREDESEEELGYGSLDEVEREQGV